MGGPRRPRAAGTQAARVVAGLSLGGGSQLSNLGLQGWWDMSREAERGRESVWGSKIPSPPPGGFLPAGCHPQGPACPWPAGAGGGFGGAFLLQERATGTVWQLSPLCSPPCPPILTHGAGLGPLPVRSAAWALSAAGTSPRLSWQSLALYRALWVPVPLSSKEKGSLRDSHPP